MKRHLSYLAFAISAVVAGQATAQVGTPIFSQNFDGLTLGPSVNVRKADVPSTHVLARHDAPGTIPIPDAFTHTPPTGWVVYQNWDNFGNVDLANPNYDYNDVVGNIGIGNQGNPDAGVDEWEGWSFADSDFWLTADNQNRAFFRDGLAANSIVAVADNDEYDDFGGGLGDQYMNTGMTTNNIPVTGKTTVNFSFDSSWRNEDHDDNHVNFPDDPNTGENESFVNNQTSIFYASFDGGAPVVVNQWNSDDADPNFKADAENERVDFNITVPAGAQNMKLTLGQLNSANDWWWAVDNLKVADTADGPGFWTEDFESVQLGPSVNERLSETTFVPSGTAETSPYPNSFTHTGPTNWSTNNDSLFTGFANDDVGLFEFEGWTYTTKDFQARASSNTQLAAFAKSTGNFAIADSDGYTTPLGTGFSGANEDITAGFTGTILQTPAISLAGLDPNTLKMQFDSAWRNSGVQTAEITVQYGNGPETTVLNWVSGAPAGDPKLHADNLNETVNLSLNNPAGATSAVFRFKYEGTDNWFWAIDNVLIGTAGASVDTDGDGDRDGADFLALQRSNSSGIAQWKTSFGSGPVSAVPEPSTVALLTLGAALVAWRRRVGKA